MKAHRLIATILLSLAASACEPGDGGPDDLVDVEALDETEPANGREALDPAASAGAGRSVEEAFPGRRGEVREGFLRVARGVAPVTYEEIDGQLVYQGDILLNPARLFATPEEARPEAAPRSAVITEDDYLWEDNVVPYVVDPSFPLDYQQDVIQPAIAYWNAETALQLVPRTDEDDYVRFELVSQGCSSHVGRDGGEQELKLELNCSLGNAKHEIGHAIGLYHEQSRWDRDSHVLINWNNIADDEEHNFEYRPTDGCFIFDCGPETADYLTYDYGSLMHYSSTAFAKSPGLLTITKLDGTAITEYQRDVLSATDLSSVHLMYGLYGAIRQRWNQVGGLNGYLGAPITPERYTPDNVGRFNRFQGGAIYWHPSLGAHDLSMGIFRHFYYGGELATFGYPLTNDTLCPDGAGHYVQFQKSWVYYTTSTGSQTVSNGFRTYWYSLGGPSGALRYPTAAAVRGFLVGTWSQKFQGGTISYNPINGYRVTYK